MIAKFFGPSGRQLFGAYHRPSGTASRSLGVVLCNPAPQEYRQCHFVYRQLAESLAADGFHVLRFDYFATGDSSGESREASIEQWISDIGTAVGELRDMSGVRRVGLVGTRLGASLAVLAASDGLPLAQLVLWDPVVSGSEYLAQLEDLQRRILAAVHYPEEDRRAPDELLGYVLPESMRTSLESLDLPRESLVGMPPVLLICAETRPEYESLRRRLVSSGVECLAEHVEDASLAGDTRMRDTLLANRIPQAIRGHLAGMKR